MTQSQGSIVTALLGFISGLLIGITLNVSELAKNYRTIHAQELKTQAEKP
jgi:hypothetical protein